MTDAGIFGMAVPRAYGGAELDPIAQVRVVEECSRIDGSVGWIAMIGSSGGYLAAFLEPSAAQRIFRDKNNICAGQVSYTNQRAEVVPGGYRFSGRFRFASGITHSSVVNCGVLLYEDGKPLVSETGVPRTRVLLLSINKARIIETWDTTGMRGTGSHDFVVEDAFVPEEDSFSLADGAKLKAPLYLYAPLFLVCHVAVPLGIARAALDEAKKLCKTKTLPPRNQLLQDDPLAQDYIARAETALAAARSHTYGTLGRLWETLCAGTRPSPEQRAEYRMMIVHGHQVGKQIVDDMVELTATNAVVRNSVIDRSLRDVTTACQHRQVHPRLYATAGRIFLGLEAGDPSF
jgi:alkylation response protein AidB-like acyl-CoA dehydrogenase